MKTGLYFKNILSIIHECCKEGWSDFVNRKPASRAPEILQHVGGLKSDGFKVIRGFCSSSGCEELRGEVDRLIQKYSGEIEIDSESADHRVWHSERLSPRIRDFHDDEFLHAVGESYLGTPMVNHLTLGARLLCRQGNKGSGGGWHRDSAFEKQFKSILYLTDVSFENGPFQYIPGSHTMGSVLRSFRYEERRRFTEENIARFTDAYRLRIETVSARAGDLILVDTRGIHRGMPIRSAERYALTNYYVAQHRHARFSGYFEGIKVPADAKAYIAD